MWAYAGLLIRGGLYVWPGDALRGPGGATLAAIFRLGIVAGLLEILIGFYEYFAYRANWWKYEPARVMVGSVCALYIPLGEFFMFLTVVPLAARAIAGEGRRMASALENGGLFAPAIVLGNAAGYVLLEVP